MKRVLLHEYNFGKIIADNLETLMSNRYAEISDEEYTRVQNSINQYLSNNNNSNILGPGVSTQDIEDLRNEINSIKPSSYDVEEEGLFFVDENGFVCAKIISTGFYAINFPGNNENSSNASELNDLSDVDITNPQDGESLLYNLTSQKWENTSTESTSVNFTIIDY